MQFCKKSLVSENGPNFNLKKRLLKMADFFAANWYTGVLGYRKLAQKIWS